MGGRAEFYLATLTVLCLALWTKSPVTAEYDEDFCKKKTSWGKDIDIKPYFFEDYSVVSESTYFEVENETKAMVTHRKIFYSSENKEVVVTEETPDETFWVFMDEESEDCIYKLGSETCKSEEHNCKKTARRTGFGDAKNNKFNLGSPTDWMDYPSNIKKTVKFPPSHSRNIKTQKIGICSYNEDTQRTVVTYVHMLDSSKYEQMNQFQNKVVSMSIWTKSPDGKTAFQRRDVTDYRQLTPYQQANSFTLGENRCGFVRDRFTSKTPPKPTLSFSYTFQDFAANTQSFSALAIVSGVHEYNYNAQTDADIQDIAADDQSEKNTVMKLRDYRGKISFKYSFTNTDCEVKPLSTTHQQSSRHFWQLDAPRATYLGVYINREIPCDVWHFHGTPEMKYVKTITLYTATSDWLKSQGLPADMFYPVEKVEKADDVVEFQEVYAFKDKPGYHIQSLPTCHELNDTVTARVTLLMDFRKEISGRIIHFTYEFRTLLQKITGIKTPIRFGRISPRPSRSAPKTETDVYFNIYGKFVGYNDPNDDIYKTDPVTTQEAVEKINRQIDGGNIQFSLDGQQMTVTFKKRSLSILDSRSSFHYFDVRNTADGYSSGAMAGVAITLLLICFALGVAAVYGYKRWSEGGAGGTSFGMSNLREDA